MIGSLMVQAGLAEYPDARCPKNLIARRFLWKKWTEEGPHDMQPAAMKRWGLRSWHEFEVTGVCRRCGAHKTAVLSDVERIRVNLPLPEDFPAWKAALEALPPPLLPSNASGGRPDRGQPGA